MLFLIYFADTVPKLLNQAIDATNHDIQRSLVLIMDNVNMFTTAIDNCYKITEDNQGYNLTLELPEGVYEEDLQLIKDLLIVYRQYELFVRYYTNRKLDVIFSSNYFCRKILVEIGRIEKVSREKFQNLQDAFLRLHETVRFRIAIPTIQVFVSYTRS